MTQPLNFASVQTNYLLEADFPFFFFIFLHLGLMQSIQAIFLFSSACFRTQSPGVNTHICALHSLSHRHSHKPFLQSFNCTFAVPVLILPSSQMELNAPVPTQLFLSCTQTFGYFQVYKYTHTNTNQHFKQHLVSILNSI